MEVLLAAALLVMTNVSGFTRSMSAVMASGSPRKRQSVLVLSTVFVPEFQVTFFMSV